MTLRSTIRTGRLAHRPKHPYVLLVTSSTDELIVYSHTSKIFLLCVGFRHYRSQGSKFRPMLSTHGFLQWELFYVPHLLRHGTLICMFSSERLVPTYSRATVKFESATWGSWDLYATALTTAPRRRLMNWNFYKRNDITYAIWPWDVVIWHGQDTKE
jgi:hypothetical protein